MELFPKVLLDVFTIIGGFSGLIFIYEKLVRKSPNKIIIDTNVKRIEKERQKDIAKININKKALCFFISLITGSTLGIIVLYLQWSDLMKVLICFLILPLAWFSDVIATSKSQYKDSIEVIIPVTIIWGVMVLIISVIYSDYGYSVDVYMFFVINILFSIIYGVFHSIHYIK